MPLAWAHAEFIKLLISRHLGYPVDRPEAVWQRYGGRRSVSKRGVWCWHARINQIKRGTALMIALPRAALVHWGMNGWRTVADGKTQETGLGLNSEVSRRTVRLHSTGDTAMGAGPDSVLAGSRPADRKNTGIPIPGTSGCGSGVERDSY
jgi:hypothetical protein